MQQVVDDPGASTEQVADAKEILDEITTEREDRERETAGCVARFNAPRQRAPSRRGGMHLYERRKHPNGPGREARWGIGETN